MPPHIPITREQYFQRFGTFPPQGVIGVAIWSGDAVLEVLDIVDAIDDEVKFLEKLYQL
jgi:hypothetical protein